eukprot:6189161-Pleurochrysis_carterae.AAC.1
MTTLSLHLRLCLFRPAVIAVAAHALRSHRWLRRPRAAHAAPDRARVRGALHSHARPLPAESHRFAWHSFSRGSPFNFVAELP